MRLRHIFRHIGEAKAGGRGVQHLEGAVESELALDVHAQFAAFLLEFPGIKPAMRRKSQIDAAMPNEFLRRLRLGARREILGRPDDGDA